MSVKKLVCCFYSAAITLIIVFRHVDPLFAAYVWFIMKVISFFMFAFLMGERYEK